MDMGQAMPPSAMKFAKEHISKQSACYTSASPAANNRMAVNKLTSSQSWTIKGHYNYTKYAGDLEPGGKQSHIMAIAIAYARIPRAGVKLGAASNAAADPATTAARGKGGNLLMKLFRGES